ncbi:MAG: antibiotic biosynthesis monooxygenase family protein [Acidobacteriota bacterium]
MFVRIAEFSLKSQARFEFLQLMNTSLIPLVRRQPGCLDTAVLVSDEDPNLGLCVTFWNSRQQAGRFHDGEEFRQLLPALQACLSDDSRVTTYYVDSSTCHRISLRRAA